MDETLNGNVVPNNSNPSTPLDPGQIAKDIQNFDTQPVPEDLDMKWSRRKCLVCGYVHEGATPLIVCPKCGNDNPDKFGDAE